MNRPALTKADLAEILCFDKKGRPTHVTVKIVEAVFKELADRGIDLDRSRDGKTTL